MLSIMGAIIILLYIVHMYRPTMFYISAMCNWCDSCNTGLLTTIVIYYLLSIWLVDILTEK